jgi:hypothetical protein
VTPIPRRAEDPTAAATDRAKNRAPEHRRPRDQNPTPSIHHSSKEASMEPFLLSPLSSVTSSLHECHQWPVAVLLPPPTLSPYKLDSHSLPLSLPKLPLSLPPLGSLSLVVRRREVRHRTVHATPHRSPVRRQEPLPTRAAAPLLAVVPCRSLYLVVHRRSRPFPCPPELRRPRSTPAGTRVRSPAVEPLSRSLLVDAHELTQG